MGGGGWWCWSQLAQVCGCGCGWWGGRQAGGGDRAARIWPACWGGGAAAWRCMAWEARSTSLPMQEGYTSVGLLCSCCCFLLFFSVAEGWRRRHWHPVNRAELHASCALVPLLHRREVCPSRLTAPNHPQPQPPTPTPTPTHTLSFGQGVGAAAGRRGGTARRGGAGRGCGISLRAGQGHPRGEQ